MGVGPSSGCGIIAVGVAGVVAGTVLTLGLADAVVATAAAIDTTEAIGVFESISLPLFDAPYVIGTGVAVAGAGGLLIGVGVMVGISPEVCT